MPTWWHGPGIPAEEAEAGGPPGVEDQPEIHSETLF